MPGIVLRGSRIYDLLRGSRIYDDEGVWDR